MPKEIEARFLDIEPIKYRKILSANGCKLVHKKTLFRRAAFYLCNPSIKGFCRVRDEGNGVTLTSKTYKDGSLYAEESEVKITGDYESGIEFFKSLGLVQKAYQESYREKWSHPLAKEITIDILPGLPPYTEIETDTEAKLAQITKLLNLDPSKMRFGSFGEAYNEYYGIELDVINNKTPSLTFANITKEIKPKKNKKLLLKIAQS
jgi:adenylate cyclase class IV